MAERKRFDLIHNPVAHEQMQRLGFAFNLSSSESDRISKLLQDGWTVVAQDIEGIELEAPEEEEPNEDPKH